MIIIIFNYAVAAPVRVHAAGLYRCIIYIRGEPYRAGENLSFFCYVAYIASLLISNY